MNPKITIADQNTERLIETAYHPEQASPAFAANLEQVLTTTAQTLAQQQQATTPPPSPATSRNRWRRAALILGGLAASVLIVYALSSSRRPSPAPVAPYADLNFPFDPPVRGNLANWTADALDGMKPRKRPDGPALAMLPKGESLTTKVGQRRLVQLADGTRLYVNEKTEVEATADRQLTLHKGQIYVEVAPKDDAAKFVVKAAGREMTATGTHFAVQSDKVAAGVVVTQGKVAVKDSLRKELEVTAGQRVAPGKFAVSTAPRASHTLDWTRELMAAAETPMVPGCQHAGGALLALDPQGQEIKLALRQYHIDVHIEDGFARTTIDQTYFNTTWERLEGTFYFPLPADASLSRLAMYVANGNECILMEGGMAERKHAADVYETIRYQRRDPALLEWLDGSTFKMRVFPLEAKQEKRIVLSYTQKLPSLYGNARYRFPGGHNMPLVRDWSFSARVKNGAGMNVWSPSHEDMQRVPQKSDVTLSFHNRNVKPEEDVILEMQEPNAALDQNMARFGSFLYEDHQYLMLRFRPNLPSLPERQRRDWIVLFEASAQRDPLLAGTQVDIFRQLLKNAEYDDTFTLLTVNTKAQTFHDKPQPARPKNVDEAIAFLQKTHLVGALDLQQGLQAAVKAAKTAKNPHILHIGSGIPAMGERDAAKLAQLLPAKAPYVGVGVGKRWNRSFMKAAAERTNGLFTQINPDEVIAWRSFELLATLNTPRLLNIQVVDVNDKSPNRFLLETTMLAQGEELCAVMRADTGKTPIPGTVLVKGTLNGKPYVEEFSVQNVQIGAGYLPRTWAKQEIDRLLAEDGTKHKDAIISLSKAMYVMSPYTSLLVLETEADYARFNVDKGRKDHWAMYACPAKIPLVYEPNGNVPPKDVRNGRKPTVDEVLATITHRPMPARGISFSTVDVDPPWTVLDTDINFMVERIADISVPGSVNPNQAIGIRDGDKIGMPVKMPFNVPAPGEFGNNGQGGAIEQLFIRKTPITNGDFAENKVKLTKVLERVQEQQKRDVLDIQKISAKLTVTTKTHNEDLRLLFRRKKGIPRWDDGGSGGQAAPPERVQFAPVFKSPTMNWTASESALKGERQALEVGYEQIHAEQPILRQRTLHYQRPVLHYDRTLFTDLVQYAPGLHNTSADILAALEAEADVELPKPGIVESAARQLIAKSRSADWAALTIAAQGPLPSYKIVYNGKGQFSYERLLAGGLREQVICDGTTIWHLYPEIGLGAKRPMSRHHQELAASINPAFLPSADELARGYDLRAIDATTVALVPVSLQAAPLGGGLEKHHRMHLLFAKDGRLSERRIVEMPTGKTLRRQIFHANGSVEWKDAEGKSLAKETRAVTLAKAPTLQPSVGDLVLVEMPTRTSAYWMAPERAKAKTHSAEQWLVSESTTPTMAEQQVVHHFGTNFHVKGDRRLGFYTLLNARACRINPFVTAIDNKLWFCDIEKEHPDSPLAKFLAHEQRELCANDSIPLRNMSGPKDGFLQRLSQFRNLWITWHNQLPIADGGVNLPLHKTKVMEFLKETTSPAAAYAILDAMHMRCNLPPTDAMLKLVEKRLGPISDPLGLGYVFRYEQARTLMQAGSGGEAAKRFRALHAETLKHGILPPIDPAFRDALQNNGPNFQAFTRTTLNDLLSKKRYGLAFQLAMQTEQLGDGALADEILTTILKSASAAESNALTIVCVRFHAARNNFAEADRLLGKVLEDKKFSQYPELWRWRAELTRQAGQVGVAMACLERALDLEYAELPEVVNLESIRAEYRLLLQHYQKIAESNASLEIAAPKTFLAKVIRAADRWRLIDGDASEPCTLAGKIFHTMDERDLAWDYWTTPIDLHPAESRPWLELAETMKTEGALDRADHAFGLAFETEPTNPEILWRRAQNQVSMGQPERARQLYRQIVAGQWQERFQNIVWQARNLAGQ